MERDVYIKVEFTENSGYIRFDNVLTPEEMAERYDKYVEISKGWNRSKWESSEGHHLQYILVTVTHDGRRGIEDSDMLKALAAEGFAYKAASGGLFADYYHLANKLTDILDVNLKRRKEFAVTSPCRWRACGT